jgi:hypothetical protein
MRFYYLAGLYPVVEQERPFFAKTSFQRDRGEGNHVSKNPNMTSHTKHEILLFSWTISSGGGRMTVEGMTQTLNST